MKWIFDDFQFAIQKLAWPPKTVITNEMYFRHPVASSDDLFSCSTSIRSRLFQYFFISQSRCVCLSTFREKSRKVAENRPRSQQRKIFNECKVDADFTLFRHRYVSEKQWLSKPITDLQRRHGELFVYYPTLGSMPEEVSPEKARARDLWLMR